MATENNVLLKIIKKHARDVVYGNNREGLNYVDVIYPFVEKVFSFDTCMAAMGNKDALEEYYSENYSGSPSYSEIEAYIERVIVLCKATENERDLIDISDDLVNYAEKVVKTKKSKNNVK